MEPAEVASPIDMGFLSLIDPHSLFRHADPLSAVSLQCASRLASSRLNASDILMVGGLQPIQHALDVLQEALRFSLRCTKAVEKTVDNLRHSIDDCNQERAELFEELVQKREEAAQYRQELASAHRKQSRAHAESPFYGGREEMACRECGKSYSSHQALQSHIFKRHVLQSHSAVTTMLGSVPRFEGSRQPGPADGVGSAASWILPGANHAPSMPPQTSIQREGGDRQASAAPSAALQTEVSEMRRCLEELTASLKDERQRSMHYQRSAGPSGSPPPRGGSVWEHHAEYSAMMEGTAEALRLAKHQSQRIDLLEQQLLERDAHIMRLSATMSGPSSLTASANVPPWASQSSFQAAIMAAAQAMNLSSPTPSSAAQRAAAPHAPAVTRRRASLERQTVREAAAPPLRDLRPAVADEPTPTDDPSPVPKSKLLRATSLGQALPEAVPEPAASEPTPQAQPSSTPGAPRVAPGSQSPFTPKQSPKELQPVTPVQPHEAHVPVRRALELRDDPPGASVPPRAQTPVSLTSQATPFDSPSRAPGVPELSRIDGGATTVQHHTAVSSFAITDMRTPTTGRATRHHNGSNAASSDGTDGVSPGRRMSSVVEVQPVESPLQIAQHGDTRASTPVVRDAADGNSSSTSTSSTSSTQGEGSSSRESSQASSPEQSPGVSKTAVLTPAPLDPPPRT